MWKVSEGMNIDVGLHEVYRHSTMGDEKYCAQVESIDLPVGRVLIVDRWNFHLDKVHRLTNSLNLAVHDDRVLQIQYYH